MDDGVAALHQILDSTLAPRLLPTVEMLIHNNRMAGGLTQPKDHPRMKALSTRHPSFLIGLQSAI